MGIFEYGKICYYLLSCVTKLHSLHIYCAQQNNYVFEYVTAGGLRRWYLYKLINWKSNERDPY